MLLTIKWGALLAAVTGSRRRMRRLSVCLGRLPGRPSTLPTVVTEAAMSGWWWAPKNSDGGEQSRSRAVTPSSVTRAYSSVTRVLPIIWLQRCNAAKLQRGNAASDSRRFLTRDLDLKSPTYKVSRWSREPPVHSQTVPDSSPER